MNLRKFFNCPSYIESKLIMDGCNMLRKMADEESFRNNEEDRKRQNDMDTVCQKCKGKEIVNKISRVEGSGYVDGSFMLGCGSIYGSSTTDTNEVNHCNKCGNQWKKI